jgi:segregation and condensation protein A
MKTDPGAFAVELPVFSGPFKLLAEMILDHKFDVCDVPVADVTTLFLARSKEAQTWSLDEATWFLAMCAVLLELKVGRLTPRHDELSEEDLLGGSPDLAYARGVELVAFRRVARDLESMLEHGALYHAREAGPTEEFADLYPDVLEKVTPDLLAEAAAVLLRPPPGVDLSHVAPIRASVADAIRDVSERLEELGEARFRDLVADCRERIHVVVRFLALLELHREGRVELSQAETFGEIEVRLQDQSSKGANT